MHVCGGDNPHGGDGSGSGGAGQGAKGRVPCHAAAIGAVSPSFDRSGDELEAGVRPQGSAELAASPFPLAPLWGVGRLIGLTGSVSWIRRPSHAAAVAAAAFEAREDPPSPADSPRQATAAVEVAGWPRVPGADLRRRRHHHGQCQS